ncbi:MAG: LysM repeat protein [Bacteroidia bacterium]
MGFKLYIKSLPLNDVRHTKQLFTTFYLFTLVFIRECKVRKRTCNGRTFAESMGKKFLLFTLSATFILDVFGQTKMTRNEYIATYKDYAIIEMHRAGVPASITLAQGILESSDGNSRLASEGNNHFGIKCKSDWKGSTMRADDDAPNECFRAYNSALESYRDHSDFLRSNWRYHELFDLDIMDYRRWAEGLRKAGYATNTSYHTIIINIVEKHQLYQHDLAASPDAAKPMMVSDNEVPMVYAQKGQTFKSIAQKNDLTAKQIYKYNDVPQGHEVEEGDIVYLKPKRRRGTEKYHVLEEGDNMYQISQSYGIKLKHLYRRNRLEIGNEPVVGEKIYMRGKRDKDDVPEIIPPAEIAKKKEQVFVNPHTIVKAPPIEREQIELPDYHVVQTGDNIYRIAEKYHVFEEDLLKWNQIDALQLTIGQKIYLTEAGAKASRTKTEKAAVPTIPKVDVASSSSTFHLVEKGETVYRICQTYKITDEQLKAWNKLADNNIYAGQRLRVSE